MIEVLTAEGFRRTGRLLQGLLDAVAINPVVEGYATYGMRWHGECNTELPSLNRNCGVLNKLEQGKLLQQRGVPVVVHLTQDEAVTSPAWPLLGRKLSHTRGRDILVTLDANDVPLRIQAGAEFFTIWVPSAQEFRVWMYRGMHLGTYRKVLRYPEQYKRVGRNYHNGWAFELVRAEELANHRPMLDITNRAVRALNLDFGAVDMIQSEAYGYVVLEVNSAPGVEGEDRQVIRKLADKILSWRRSGFPRRKEWNESAAAA